jgi:hypothetical protein
VTCVTLDWVLEDGSAGVPSIVKIDAEGAEIAILLGGRQVMSETGARFIVEFTDAQVLAEARALLPERSFEALSDRHWLLTRR